MDLEHNKEQMISDIMRLKESFENFSSRFIKEIDRCDNEEEFLEIILRYQELSLRRCKDGGHD